MDNLRLDVLQAVQDYALMDVEMSVQVVLEPALAVVTVNVMLLALEVVLDNVIILVAEVVVQAVLEIVQVVLRLAQVIVMDVQVLVILVAVRVVSQIIVPIVAYKVALGQGDINGYKFTKSKFHF